jgi:glycosyltransferase involved in cell wall biosynthesis
MEYYADMGDGQGSETASLVASVQRFALPRCSLILAASDEIADLLEVEYSIPRPTPIYNTPSIVEHLPKRDPAMSLYWRNYQVGFGQRGLDDALVALTMLPSDLKLFLQGNPPHDGGEELRHRVDELGLQGRVILLPPFAPGSAITEAAKHTIGLCLERQGPRNHELTVSNKFFDYLMAGLVVVASNMPSLKRVAERSGAALTYQAGSPDSLAAVIRGLVRDPTRLRNLSERGRKFALLEGNSDYDNAKFINAFKQIL